MAFFTFFFFFRGPLAGAASQTGLPDGVFSDQKFQFAKIWESPEAEHVALFYGHFEYINAVTVIWQNAGNLVYSHPPFGILY
jgi:hypothetical protein